MNKHVLIENSNKCAECTRTSNLYTRRARLYSYHTRMHSYSVECTRTRLRLEGVLRVALHLHRDVARALILGGAMRGRWWGETIVHTYGNTATLHYAVRVAISQLQKVFYQLNLKLGL